MKLKIKVTSTSLRDIEFCYNVAQGYRKTLVKRRNWLFFTVYYFYLIK